MRKCAWVLALLLCWGSPSWAVTPQEAQQACQDLANAAEAAKKELIQVAVPKQDPGRTFQNATQSCLVNIARFKDIFTFKSITGAAIQQFVTETATNFMNKYCQAANDEFNRRVQDALGTLNAAGGGYVSVTQGGVQVNPPNVGRGGLVAPGGSASQPPPSATPPAQEEPGWFGGLINRFRGVNPPKQEPQP